MLRLIALSFFAPAAYVTAEPVRTFGTGAALFIAFVAEKKGRTAWRGEHCC